MKKLIMLCMFALSSTLSFAANTEKCIESSTCQQVKVYYKIQVTGLVFPGNWGFPTQQVFHTEYGWYTTLELDTRKAVLKAMYPDSYTVPGGQGVKYSVDHKITNPPAIPVG